MDIKQIRDYPKIGKDDILLTYKENVEEDKMDPRQAWKLAQHLHRIYPFMIKKYDHLIPYQGRDWAEGIQPPRFDVDNNEKEPTMDGEKEEISGETENAKNVSSL